MRPQRNRQSCSLTVKSCCIYCKWELRLHLWRMSSSRAYKNIIHENRFKPKSNLNFFIIFKSFCKFSTQKMSNRDFFFTGILVEGQCKHWRCWHQDKQIYTIEIPNVIGRQIWSAVLFCSGDLRSKVFPCVQSCILCASDQERIEGLPTGWNCIYSVTVSLKPKW